jgi:hypothetical protein
LKEHDCSSGQQSPLNLFHEGFRRLPIPQSLPHENHTFSASVDISIAWSMSANVHRCVTRGFSILESVKGWETNP